MAHLELDAWMHAICRKVFPFIFPGFFFHLPQPWAMLLRIGPHETTWCSLENQSCQMHRRTGSGTPRAVGCCVCWILVLSVSVIRKVLRASWQWIFSVKVLAVSKFKNFQGGLFAFYFVPFHAKNPFSTASRRHRNTSIAGGSEEETLNPNRIPGTAGSARISVRLSSRGSIENYNGCLGASQLGFNPTATHLNCIIEAPTSRRIFFNIAMLLPDWDAVRVLDKHFRRSLNLQMMLIFILCTALLLSRCQGELTRYTWSLCLADAVDRDQLRALKVCTWRCVSLVKLVTVCSFERCISKRPSKSFGRQSEIGWWSGWIEYCICKHVGT